MITLKFESSDAYDDHVLITSANLGRHFEELSSPSALWRSGRIDLHRSHEFQQLSHTVHTLDATVTALQTKVKELEEKLKGAVIIGGPSNSLEERKIDV